MVKRKERQDREGGGAVIDCVGGWVAGDLKLEANGGLSFSA